MTSDRIENKRYCEFLAGACGRCYRTRKSLPGGLELSSTEICSACAATRQGDNSRL